MNKRQHRDDYYPLRWRIADITEDIFLLHRKTIIGALAIFGLAAILAGFFLFDGEDATNTDTAASTPTTVEAAVEPEDTNVTTTTQSTTTSTTTAPQTTTTTEAPQETTTTTTTESPRAPTNDGAVAATENGRVVRVTNESVEVIGGLPTESAADEAFATAAEVFPDLSIDDRQLVDPSFTDGPVNFRIDAPDLFEYNSDAIDPIYLPVIDQLAASIIAKGWTVEVGGHTDGSGPSEGNQVLSEGRAASATARLVAQGVDPASITTVGFGESQPIADNATESGRLLNRRVEFVVSL